MRLGRETWILGALLAVFVVASVLFTRQGYETEAREQPSTYSPAPKGLKAIYEFLGRRHLATSRFERPLSRLPDSAGVLVIAEPLARPVTDAEQNALVGWVQRGGTVVVVASGGWHERARDGVTLSHVIVSSDGTATGTASASPRAPTDLAADIPSLRLSTSTRLLNEAEDQQTTVYGDDAGACVISWRVGSGTAVAIADAAGVGNGVLGASDTALLFLNIAAAHTSPSRSTVLFDEYHQGHGQVEGDEPSLWAAIGRPMRTAIWLLLGLAAVAIVSANRRFGRPLVLNRQASRPSTEYVDSMADLYQRAGASGIAVDLLYRPFVRDLAQRVDAPAAAGHHDIAALAERRFGWRAAELEEFMRRCEAITSGAGVTEQEMLHLAQQMDDYRRRADLVRLSRRSVDDRKR